VTDNSAWQQAAGESTYPTYPSQPAMGGAASQSSSEAETTRLQTPAQPQTQMPVSAPPLAQPQSPTSAPPGSQAPASPQSQLPANAPASGSGQPMFPQRPLAPTSAYTTQSVPSAGAGRFNPQPPALGYPAPGPLTPPSSVPQTTQPAPFNPTASYAHPSPPAPFAAGGPGTAPSPFAHLSPPRPGPSYPAATGFTGMFPSVSPGAPQLTPPGSQPASAPPVPQNGGNTAWWTNATTDPWRDPQAPAVVVTSPPGTLPPLESMPQMMPPAKRGVGLGLVLMISLVSALFAGVLGGTLGYVFSERNRSNSTQVGSKPGTLTQRAPGTLAELVKKALPSVVTIRVKVQGGTSLGSGFVVSATGYIVTNNHVVEDGTGQMVVSFSDSTTASATLVGSDAESDLAVI
jgi:hypothetical protein